MKRRRYSLPAERPFTGPESSLLRTSGPLFALLTLAPAFGYIWHGLTHGVWGWSLIGLICGTGFAFIVARDLFARSTECNDSTYDRCRQPIRYWLTLGVWFFGYVFSTASLFLMRPR